MWWLAIQQSYEIFTTTLKTKHAVLEDKTLEIYKRKRKKKQKTKNGEHEEQKQLLKATKVKNLPVMQETRVQNLGREEPLEKGMAIHSSILAGRIPWTEEPGGLQSVGLQRVEQNWATHIDTHTHHFIRCVCMESIILSAEPYG